MSSASGDAGQVLRQRTQARISPPRRVLAVRGLRIEDKQDSMFGHYWQDAEYTGPEGRPRSWSCPSSSPAKLLVVERLR